MVLIILLAGLTNPSSFARAQSVRWQAGYTSIYSDDIETIGPSLGSVFTLGSPGSLTTVPSEVVSGRGSIRGVNAGSLPFLTTNSSVLPLLRNHPYSVRFDYKILTASSNFFYVQFLSYVAASQGNFLNGATITGQAGTTGAITLNNVLGNYSDYVVFWNVTGNTGTISIDNIQITDQATGQVIASEDGEALRPTIKAGFQSQAATVNEPSQVLSGRGSVLLGSQAGITTNPAVLPLAGNTTYTIKFDYRIISRGTADNLLSISLQPPGTTDPKLRIIVPGMLKNAASTGSFSSGAQTAGASSYVMGLSTAPGVVLIIDNTVLYRQDVTTQSATPPSWRRLLTAPYPRLGNKFEARTDFLASIAPNEGTPFAYSVEQIENRVAFSDVIANQLANQTHNPDSIHRIRALNPNAVILGGLYVGQQSDESVPYNASIDLEYQLSQSIPKEWKATDTAGNVIYDVNYPGLFFLDLSDFAPIVNGQTWQTVVQNFLATKVFPSGLWDGVFLSQVAGVLDPAFPHMDDPALFNYDWNRNGRRDETLAATHEMQRAAKLRIIQQLNSRAQGLQFTMANTTVPDFALAPLVNGFVWECFNNQWDQPSAPITSSSPARWRTMFETYLRMQAAELSPQTNIVEGCGQSAADLNTGPNPSNHYLNPTTDDIWKHRFTMGTALLGSGFYEYDLKDPLGAPYWFDEFSVDSEGNAVEDRTKKGYLGQPLSDATELTTPATVVFQEGFDDSALSSAFIADPGAVSVTQTPGEVISGAGSLVLNNPDHSKRGLVTVTINRSVVPLNAGVTYLLSFDWRVLETLDFRTGLQVYVQTPSQNAESAAVPGTVTGDSGTMHFPMTMPSTGDGTIRFFLFLGGGKVAIDNVTIQRGGVGPWRRDFENGFVLVNPFKESQTFSAAELRGLLNRTGIHRIKGTQAPDVNNGQAVSGDLTLGPFDSIILLAHHIDVPGCSYALDLAGAFFSAAGGTGTLNIAANPGCPWSVIYPPSWARIVGLDTGVGSGSVQFQVDSLTTGSRSGAFNIAGRSFTIVQNASPDSSFVNNGSIAQIAAGGSWKTIFTLINTSSAPQTARLSFFSDNGNPLALRLKLAESSGGFVLASTIDRTVGPGAGLVIETSGSDGEAVQVGWARLLTTGGISAFAVFQETMGAMVQEAAVPVEWINGDTHKVWFDTTGNYAAGVAVANLKASGATVGVVIRNDAGTILIQDGIAMAAMGHTSFGLVGRYPSLQNRRGTIEFIPPTGGQISLIGLRFNPTGAFSTTPPVIGSGAGGAGIPGSIAQIAAEGNWKTIFTLLAPGASSSTRLNFFDDGGNTIILPLAFPQTGSAFQQLSSYSGTINANAGVVIETAGPNARAVQVGSAQMPDTMGIAAYAVFQLTVGATVQEAAVPLDTSRANAYVMWVENVGGFTTGTALANVSNQAGNVAVTIRDASGVVVTQDSIALPAHGHTSFDVAGRYPVIAQQRGTIEFATPQNGQISVLGLRFNPTGAFSTIPPAMK